MTPRQVRKALLTERGWTAVGRSFVHPDRPHVVCSLATAMLLEFGNAPFRDYQLMLPVAPKVGR
jgi:hypothetical protein